MTQAAARPPSPPPTTEVQALNHLLRSMTADEQERLSGDLHREHLRGGRTLYRPGDLADQLFFPEDALLSVSARLRGGALVETNVVGVEGAVGLVEASAKGVMASHVRVHSAGSAWRLSAASFQAAVAASPTFQAAAGRHAEDVVAELRQSVICHTHHTLDQRLSRWILERRDQLDGDSIPVTRACLADLLGAQRTSVSEAAGRLQRRGLIRSVRAAVVVTNKAGLEAAACECRATLATARATRQAAGPHLELSTRVTSRSAAPSARDLDQSRRETRR